MDNHGTARIHNADGAVVILCLTNSMIEVFSAVALSRWNMIFWDDSGRGDLETGEIEERLEEWRLIHARAVKGR